MQFKKKKKNQIMFPVILDFFTNWEGFRSIVNFFQPTGKTFGTRNLTQFCIGKKPWCYKEVVVYVYMYRHKKYFRLNNRLQQCNPYPSDFFRYKTNWF